MKRDTQKTSVCLHSQHTNTQTVTPSTKHSHLAHITPASFKCSPSQSVSHSFTVPPRARSPLRRLSVRLRHSRSNTSTKYSLPGAFTGVSQEAITKRCKVKAERGNGRRTRAGPMSCNRTLSALHRYLGSTHKSTDRLGTQASVLTLYQTTLESHCAHSLAGDSIIMPCSHPCVQVGSPRHCRGALVLIRKLVMSSMRGRPSPKKTWPTCW